MYTAKDIRNICLLGHGGDGKSALAESMLFLTKAIDRLGKRTDGNTTSDFDPEEIKRGYSISTSVLPVEYNKCKLNVLDNPGYFAFSGEVAQSLRVVDAGLICLTAKGGIAIAIRNELGLPVYYIGFGEQIDDLRPFNAQDFVDALFGGREETEEDA